MAEYILKRPWNLLDAGDVVDVPNGAAELLAEKGIIDPADYNAVLNAQHQAAQKKPRPSETKGKA